MCAIQLTVFLYSIVIFRFGSLAILFAISSRSGFMCIDGRRSSREKKKRFNERRQTHGRPTRASARGDGRSSEGKKRRKKTEEYHRLLHELCCVRWCEMMLFYTHSPTVSHLISLLLLLFFAFIIFISHSFFFSTTLHVRQWVYRQTWSCRAAKCYFFLFMMNSHESRNPRHFVRSSSSFDFLMFGSHFFFARRWQRWKFPVNFFPPRHRARIFANTTHSMSHRRSAECCTRESMMSWEHFFSWWLCRYEWIIDGRILTLTCLTLSSSRVHRKRLIKTPKKSSVHCQTFLLCVSSKNSRKPNELSDGRAECGWGSLATFFSTLFHSAILQVVLYIFFRALFESLLCNLNKVFDLTVEVDEMKWEEKVFSRRPTIVIFFLRLLMNLSRLPNIYNGRSLGHSSTAHQTHVADVA